MCCGCNITSSASSSLVFTAFSETLSVVLREVACWTNQAFPFSFSSADYLQYSRAFYLISVLTILISLGWLFSACLPRRGSVTTYLDLKVSMLSFISGTNIDRQGDARVKLSREQSFSVALSSQYFFGPFPLVPHQAASYWPCLII